MSQIEQLGARESNKEQPWKLFWPLKTESLSEQDVSHMPWIPALESSEAPEAKPWFGWLQKESEELTSMASYVCRSGTIH